MRKLLTFSSFCALLILLSTSAAASVKYVFVVSEQPSDDFFKPLYAEMVLSDSAVSARRAEKGQIESVIISGGPTMQEANRITLSYLHDAFEDLTVTLSSDRQTITSLAATISPASSMSTEWVFHYQRPEHPTLMLHEFVGYIKSDSVTVETTILPVPPRYIRSSFVGEWQRVSSCWSCSWTGHHSAQPFLFCWVDWFIIISVVIVVSIAVWRLQRRKSKKTSEVENK